MTVTDSGACAVHSNAHLWLVRHARPLVAPGTCYGRLDVPADVQSTHDGALALARTLPQGVCVLHSPLLRCAQLAHALQALRPDVACRPEPRITEIHFGHWEGHAWNDIPRADIDAWTACFAHYAPGGGESLVAMLARVRVALQATRQHADTHKGDTVWITHAGVARCVNWLRLHDPQRLPVSHEWPLDAPACGAWVRLALA